MNGSRDANLLSSRHSLLSLLSFHPSSSSCSSYTSWTTAFASAIVLWMAFPPLDWWILAWVAPVPWIWLIRCKTLPGRRPYVSLWLAGFVMWLGILHWLRLPHPATSIGWIALSFYFAFYVPAFVGLSRVAVQRLHLPVMLASPVVWTGLELLRAHLFSGMPMACLGHTQCRWIELIQVSDLVGAYGVAFVVIFAAAALARMLPCDGRRWTFWPIAPMLVMFAAVLTYGCIRASGDYTSPGPKVALIQGSIDTDLCDDPDPDVRERVARERCDRIYREYVGLSDEALRKYGRIDLVVWPESMLPEPMVTFDADAAKPDDWEKVTDAEFREWLPEATEYVPSFMARLAKRLDMPLILGVDTRHFGVKSQRTYNCAVFVSRDGKMLGRYDKNHLVPYGEYVPFSDYFPWLQRFTPLPISATPGDKPVAFDLEWEQKSVRFVPSICYESVLSHLIRGQVNALAADGTEPDVLVNLTNDGWCW